MLCDIMPSCNVLKFMLVAATPQVHFRLVYDTACQAIRSALLLLPSTVMQISTLKRRLRDAGQGQSSISITHSFHCMLRHSRHQFFFRYSLYCATLQVCVCDLSGATGARWQF